MSEKSLATAATRRRARRWRSPTTTSGRLATARPSRSPVPRLARPSLSGSAVARGGHAGAERPPSPITPVAAASPVAYPGRRLRARRRAGLPVLRLQTPPAVDVAADDEPSRARGASRSRRTGGGARPGARAPRRRGLQPAAVCLGPPRAPTTPATALQARSPPRVAAASPCPRTSRRASHRRRGGDRPGPPPRAPRRAATSFSSMPDPGGRAGARPWPLLHRAGRAVVMPRRRRPRSPSLRRIARPSLRDGGADRGAAALPLF